MINITRVRAVIAILLCGAAFTFLNLLFHQPHEVVAVFKDPTRYNDLPTRLAASFYPPRNISRTILIKPIVAGCYITVLVRSAPSNFEKRNTVRKTWGSITSIGNKTICVIFMIGIADNYTQIELRKEHDTRADILQIAVAEDFQYQPIKTLSAFQCIQDNRDLDAKFYVITNDNCVINFAHTMRYLNRFSEKVESAIHCGYMFENNTGVIRGKGERSVSKDLYPNTKYPMFCRGQMVMLSATYMKKILEMAKVTNITHFYLEDVLLYGILREKLDIKNSIYNVINGGVSLLYDPWDDSDAVIEKMITKWKEWKKELEIYNVEYREVDKLTT